MVVNASGTSGKKVSGRSLCSMTVMAMYSAMKMVSPLAAKKARRVASPSALAAAAAAAMELPE